jgi:hypothetical protein
MHEYYKNKNNNNIIIIIIIIIRRKEENKWQLYPPSAVINQDASVGKALG